jgi:hypothetical protein
VTTILQFFVTVTNSSGPDCKFQIEHQNGTLDVVSASNNQTWKVETIYFQPKDFAPNRSPPKVLKVNRNVSTEESQAFLGRYWLTFKDGEKAEFNIRCQSYKTFYH